MIPAGKYIVFGRTGCGKSSFINTLANKNLAKTDDFNACTNQLKEYSFNTPDGNFKIIDTPGFCEDEDPNTDRRFLNLIKSFLENDIPDTDINSEYKILLFCKFGEKRIRTEDHLIINYFVIHLYTYNIYIRIIN